MRVLEILDSGTRILGGVWKTSISRCEAMKCGGMRERIWVEKGDEGTLADRGLFVVEYDTDYQ